MAFGAATKLTNVGASMLADRQRTSPGTYSTAPKWVGIGVGATGAARTAVVGDTALSSEVETRVSGTESTVTTNVTGDTYQTVSTLAITGTRAIDEIGTFDAVSAGHMAVSATVAVINLGTGDNLQVTAQTPVTPS